MRRTYRTFCLVVTTTVCLSFANAARADDFPKGTFTAMGPNGQTIAIKFDGKGKMIVSRGDEEIVSCEYKVEKDKVTFSNETGPRANKESKPGTYKWKLDGKKLTFTKVDDEHEGRSQGLTHGPWEKKD
jgi:hypothetical protein